MKRSVKASKMSIYHILTRQSVVYTDRKFVHNLMRSGLILSVPYICLTLVTASIHQAACIFSGRACEAAAEAGRTVICHAQTRRAEDREGRGAATELSALRPSTLSTMLRSDGTRPGCRRCRWRCVCRGVFKILIEGLSP